MIVLDTDALSEPMQLRPDARVLAWLTGLEEESAVTAVSVEVRRAQGRSRQPQGMLSVVSALAGDSSPAAFTT